MAPWGLWLACFGGYVFYYLFLFLHVCLVVAVLCGVLPDE